MYDKIDMGDRCDAEYFQKEFLAVENRLLDCNTAPLTKIVKKVVASAFYPAATQLYDTGDTPFIRCVDCVTYPVISDLQADLFERIPYDFAVGSNGISFLRRNEIVITKVGTPCYASLISGYDEVALSRTVMGLSQIHDVLPEYLMVFLRSKYGFEQLYRSREQTIQFQLTVDRIKRINVYLPSELFQQYVAKLVKDYMSTLRDSAIFYAKANTLLLDELDMRNFKYDLGPVAVKSLSESFGVSGRLDAEYYQKKYEKTETILKGEIGRFTIHDDNYIPNDRKEYRYIELADIGSSGEITGVTVDKGASLPTRARRQVKTDQVIVSSIEGSLPSCALITDEYDGALCSTGFYVVDSQHYNPETLLVLFKSSPIQELLKKRCSGTILTAISKDEMKTLPMPTVNVKTQSFIAEQVQQSFILRRQSEQLLGMAKQTVEMAIEHGEDVATAWLKDKGGEG